MNHLFLCLVLLAGLSQPIFAQNNISIKEDDNIANMMEAFAAQNKAKSFVDGWRVQIIATPDRQRLETVKQSFQYRYPSIPVTWVHVKPYYKLQAGAFTSKLEALRLKYILEQEYKGIYLVKDDAIKPQELVGRY